MKDLEMDIDRLRDRFAADEISLDELKSALLELESPSVSPAAPPSLVPGEVSDSAGLTLLSGSYEELLDVGEGLLSGRWLLLLPSLDVLSGLEDLGADVCV
ncbi:MAG: hypothetical protein AAF541_24595, partial [Pseudomonadota bacterium]